MTGTITIGLDEYEKLKALEGKKLYSGNLSQEEIDRVAKIEGECIGVQSVYWVLVEGYHHSKSIITPKNEYIEGLLNSIESKEKEISSFADCVRESGKNIDILKSRNLWERITRKYE